MSGRFRVACVQNCAGVETAANLEDCAELVRGAAAEGARLICLPEYFTGLDLKGELLLPEAFAEDAHPALPRGLHPAPAAYSPHRPERPAGRYRFASHPALRR